MRILHVYKDSYPPVHGGIEQHIALLAELQARAGHDVEILVAGARGGVERSNRDGYVVTRLPEHGRAASSPLTAGFAGALYRARPHIAHFHHPNPVAEIWAPLLHESVKTVVTYHADITRQRVMGAVYRPVLRRLLERADALITSSERLRDSSPLLATRRDRCHVVPYGVPAAAAGPPGARRLDDVLFVGRLREYKGLIVLVRALASAPGTQLRVVGRGPMEDEMVAEARALGVLDRVHLLGDLDEGQLDDEYRRAGALVLPSIRRSEAFGIVLVEALQRSTPLITTELGTGTSWVNQDGRTGMVVPAGDPRALADAMNRLRAEPARWEELSAGAGQRARDFTPERMLEGIQAAYDAVA